MGYMESKAFFCTSTETVKYRSLENLDNQSQAPLHLLETLAESKQEDDTTNLVE